MDLEEIEKLMKLLEESSLTRLAIRRKDFEIEIEKELQGAPSASQAAVAAVPMAEAPQQQAAKEPALVAPKEEPEGEYITSPMVGTIYLSPSPGDPAFVVEGDQVAEDSVICIVEAMKVMNEVKAGMNGKVAEILVKNGDPVEFGTKLFRITS